MIRPRLDEVSALRPVADRLQDAGVAALGLVCVGHRPFHPLEVAEHAGLPLRGVVADDPAAAASIFSDGLEGRGLARTRLARSVADLARSLAGPTPVRDDALADDVGAAGHRGRSDDVTTDLSRRVVEEVTGELSRWSHECERQGVRSDPGQEHAEVERLIPGALERLRRDRLAAGEAPLDADQEAAIVADTRARLIGFGPLDRFWLTRPSRTCTPTAVTGSSSPAPEATALGGRPLAATDAELIELIRRVAAQGGRTERRFDDAQPLLNLRLPDGSRFSAVMHVAGRPSLSIRRHRHTDVGLADLVRLGHARRGPRRGHGGGGATAAPVQHRRRRRDRRREDDVPPRPSGRDGALRAVGGHRGRAGAPAGAGPPSGIPTSSSSRPARRTSRARGRSPCGTSRATRCGWRRTA